MIRSPPCYLAVNTETDRFRGGLFRNDLRRVRSIDTAAYDVYTGWDIELGRPRIQDAEYIALVEVLCMRRFEGTPLSHIQEASVPSYHTRNPVPRTELQQYCLGTQLDPRLGAG